ncbi:hypothetical protein KGM_203433 [Danaus plexippus plexippus]|uniref:Uncharacterized protein n=1 Tax=Danaus plexippus plexippus TaxID=278856 RepID=A0A212FPV2_DANPL|nr:hypothetical protein KGM_203433 [Danaus plexippus plexippus]
MENYEHELEELNEKVTKLQNQSTILKEKDMIEESLKQKEKQLNVLKNKHRSAITELLGKMIENNFAISINQFECQTRTELETIKKNISEKQNEVRYQCENNFQCFNEITHRYFLAHNYCHGYYTTFISNVISGCNKIINSCQI